VRTGSAPTILANCNGSTHLQRGAAQSPPKFPMMARFPEGGTLLALVAPNQVQRPRHSNRAAEKSQPMTRSTIHSKTPPSDARQRQVATRIHQSAYTNWFLIAIVALLTLVGLALVLPPVFSDRIAELWLFSKPQMLVIAGLTLTLILLVGLAHQRRYLIALRRHFEAIQQVERERAQRQTARTYALLNVSRVMVEQNDIQTVFDSITKICVDTFACDKASLMLFDRESASLVVRAVSGKMIPEGMLGTRQALGQGVAGLVAQRREPLMLRADQRTNIPGLELRNRELTAAMIVPIILRDELVGVINVSTRSPQTNFEDEDLRALQVFAENVGAAVRHTEQAEWMRATIRRLQSQKDRGNITGIYPAQNS
jgi:putative methionine-R-sulfoxide reductase with GAF domain